MAISHRLLLYSLLFMSVFTWRLYSQVGIETVNPSENAALDIQSQGNDTTLYKGLLLPRVPTEISRNAIPTQPSDKGMLVFVRATGCLDLFNGTFWEHINCTTSVPPLETPTNVWINEFHYDNQGVDTGEFIEIAGIAGVNLSGYTLVLYNGSSGLQYNVTTLDGVLGDDTGTGFGFEVVNYNGSTIQNGAPDGMALIDNSGVIIQFLSYEGSFTASNGPAAGITSTDIGISEAPNPTEDLIGASLQLTGDGSIYTDFVWSLIDTSTAAALNAGQTIN